MADINEVLAGAKKTLADTESKFPSSKPASQPSYTQAHEARKPAPNLADELKAKGEMVQKAKTALNN